MRRLVFYSIVTADGMYADEHGGLDFYDPAEDEHRYAEDLTRGAGDIVMGRVMYSVMGYWDTLDVADPGVPEIERDFAMAWRGVPKHIASRGTPELGPNAQLLGPDTIEAVRRLKQGDGPDIGLGCGAALLATLTQAGLIDAYQVLVIPTAIGRGKALWSELDAPLPLRLVGTRTFSSGSVLLEYEPAS